MFSEWSASLPFLPTHLELEGPFVFVKQPESLRLRSGADMDNTVCELNKNPNKPKNPRGDGTVADVEMGPNPTPGKGGSQR